MSRPTTDPTRPDASRVVPVVVLMLLLSAAWVLPPVSTARAQVPPVSPPVPAPFPPGDGPAPAAAPSPSEVVDLVTAPDGLELIGPETGVVRPNGPPPGTPVPVVHYGLFDAIRESIFGDAYAKPSTWHALPLSTFFTQGWDEAFVNPTAGSGGAPRQGWINSFEGVFFRVWFVSIVAQQDVGRNGNRYVSTCSVYVPLNRRFELRLDAPFVVSSKGGEGDRYHNNAGDLTVTPRFLLSESQDFTQVFALPVRIPTGRPDNSNGVSLLGPQYQFWWNMVDNWVLRGGTGVSVPTGPDGPRTTYFADLGVGRYFPGSDDAWFRHLWVHFTINLNRTLAGTGPNVTFLGLTPGIRFNITGPWYLLAAVEVPVTTPQAYSYSPILLILRSF